MKEKIKAFFQNEKVKNVKKKVFNKKTFIAVIVVIVIVAALRVTFSLVFEVNGTVTQIDGTKITVTNFLTTQTVDVGNYPITTSGIQAGDRIEITKNLSGQVYSVRCENKTRMGRKGSVGLRKFKGNAQRNLRNIH